jgi:HSP20 family molecular chaperone IbpA
MSKDKRSFFERLAGARPVKEEEREIREPKKVSAKISEKESEEPEEEGQLTVDVYQTDDDIVIKTMTAGVKPEDLDISITRDMVTIRGRREGGGLPAYTHADAGGEL